MVERKKRKSTKTSSFGTSGRESHDSSKFYGSKLYKNSRKEVKREDLVVNPFPKAILDKILVGSSENMEKIPDNSVHLAVTSPPYNVGKDYDEDYSLEQYIEFLGKVWKEVYRVLVPGGRACINVANLGRKPYIPLHSYIIESMNEIGFLMRGEIIWDKAASAGTSTAWGSWMSASNPTLRDVHEYILIFSKMQYGRKRKGKDFEHENTITRDEFLEYTKSIWSFPSVSAKKIGHPAPYPEELPARLIKLFTFKGDVVLDPFMGSGQTAIAALKNQRHFVGYELNREYGEHAMKRIKKCKIDLNSPTLLDFND